MKVNENPQQRQKKGYSLIELTIVVGMVSVLSITISAIVLSTIVNSNRIRNQVRIRQAGDYAVGQMQTMIRNARKIVSCNSATDTLTVKGQDLGDTSFSLSGSRIASGSAGVFLTPSDVSVSNFDLRCLPSDTEPKLVQIGFTVDTSTTGERATESPPQTFSVSVGLRNE